MAQDEKRLGFRVIVAELPEFIQRKIVVEVSRGSQSSSATLVDLSMSGMLVADLGIEVEVGDSVATTLEFEDETVTLSGAVVRTVSHDSVGIRFPESLKDGEFDPPTRLANIHRAFELAWLQHRKETDGSREF